jgi:hypothetical protein
MRVGDLVKNLYPDTHQIGIILEIIKREYLVWGTMYRVLWTDGESEYMTVGDVEILNESR